MSSSLPNRPSLDHLRHQARDLQRAFAAGESVAVERVCEHLVGAASGPKLKLAQAQCVIAREYGFRSWRKLRDALAPPEPENDMEQDDPLHVRYASCILVGASEMGLLEFSLVRRDGQLFVASLIEEDVPLREFAGWFPSSGIEKSVPLPVDLVWERLLKMAELNDPQRTEGTIFLSLCMRYPHTHWVIDVSRPNPDRLDFLLQLDEVDTTLRRTSAGPNATPGQRMVAALRDDAAEPLSPEADTALEQIGSYYDRTPFHRVPIREMAGLAARTTHNADAIARCARLAGSFTYHTGSLLDIARIATECDRPRPELLQLADLVVRRLSGTFDMVRLAKELAAAQSDEELARIRADIAQLDATADFATLDEAHGRQHT